MSESIHSTIRWIFEEPSVSQTPTAAIGVLGSPRRTNEELYLLQKFARLTLGTNNLDMSAMAFHIGWLMLLAGGITDLTPQTVSLTSIQLAQTSTEVGATVSLVSGAVAGGIRVFDPVPVVFEPTG